MCRRSPAPSHRGRLQSRRHCYTTPAPGLLGWIHALLDKLASAGLVDRRKRDGATADLAVGTGHVHRPRAEHDYPVDLRGTIGITSNLAAAGDPPSPRRAFADGVRRRQSSLAPSRSSEQLVERDLAGLSRDRQRCLRRCPVGPCNRDLDLAEELERPRTRGQRSRVSAMASRRTSASSVVACLPPYGACHGDPAAV